MTDLPYKKYICTLCGLTYDEAQGWPEENIVAGTRWEEVSEDWICPDCGAGKEDFEMVLLEDAG